jgi:hypothetical protein
MASTLSGAIASLCQQHLLGLLEKIAVDYSLSVDELKGKYLDLAADSIPVAKPKKPSAKKSVSGEPRVPCEAMVKGEPCKHKAQVGQSLCHLHNRVKAPKPARVPCSGRTSKGEPCSVRAQPGETLCHLHLGRARKGKEAKAAVVPVPLPVSIPAPASTSAPLEFCEPCAEPEQAEVESNDLSAMELQERLKRIMTVVTPTPLKPTKEVLEAHGFDDEPDEFDESQMESPTSQKVLESMKGMMEENSASGSQVDEDDEGYLTE